MEGKKGEGERENDEVTIKIKGEALERVLDMRAKRERETKKPVSMTEVVNGIIMGGVVKYDRNKGYTDVESY